MESFLPCCPSVVFAFSLDNPSFSSCPGLPSLALVRYPFVLTNSNFSLANELHGVLLSRVQNFCFLLGSLNDSQM